MPGLRVDDDDEGGIETFLSLCASSLTSLKDGAGDGVEEREREGKKREVRGVGKGRGWNHNL